MVFSTKKSRTGFNSKLKAIAPGRFVFRIEIVAAVGAEIIAVRTEMVVDHVENDRETALMRCIDQSAQFVRLTVDVEPARKGARRRNPSCVRPGNRRPA